MKQHLFMQAYKIVVLGPQCSGKTTLVKYLQEHDSLLPVVDEDELLTKLNGGTFPFENKESLLLQVEEKVKNADSIIFFTSHCSPFFLKELKAKGYKIVQLEIDMPTLVERNQKRMKEEGYPDSTQWLESGVALCKAIQEQGLIDKVVDANRPVETVANEFISFFKN